MYNSLYLTTPIDNFYKDFELSEQIEEEEISCFNNKKFSFSNFFLNSAGNVIKVSTCKGNDKSVFLNESTEISETSSIFEESSMNIDKGKIKITDSFKIDWKKCIKIFKRFSGINYQNQIRIFEKQKNEKKMKKEDEKNIKNLIKSFLFIARKIKSL